jgi:hypothetical protein
MGVDSPSYQWYYKSIEIKRYRYKITAVVRDQGPAAHGARHDDLRRATMYPFPRTNDNGAAGSTFSFSVLPDTSQTFVRCDLMTFTRFMILYPHR